MLTKKHFRQGSEIIRRIMKSGSKVYMKHDNIRQHIHAVIETGAIVVNIKPATETTPGDYLAYNHKDFKSLRQFWHSFEIVAPFAKVMRDHLQNEQRIRGQQQFVRNLQASLDTTLKQNSPSPVS